MRNELSNPAEEPVSDVTLNTESTAEVAAPAAEALEVTEQVVTEQAPAEVVDEPVASEAAAETAADDDSPIASAEPSEAKAELLNALKALLEQPVDSIRDEVTQIKSTFNAIRKEELDQEKKEFVERGNEEAAFAPKTDPCEEEFKEVLNKLKELRAQHAEEVKAQQMKNLEAKHKIIDEIQAIAADPDNINKQFQRVQQLQQEFKEIGDVPQEAQTSVWKEYSQSVEHFYDLLKINKDLRDYDFKKNLEQKQKLVDDANALADVPDVIEAFRTLQALHEKWREIGPVAKEFREDIWAKFKAASAVVNKRYQAFFEARKERERENEAAKIALCERLEALIRDTELKGYAAWDEVTNKIKALQEEWKKLGFAQKRVNNELFARFRKSCDEFFEKKATYFKQMKEDLAANLEKKLALCEKAEALKDSTEWKKATDALTELQKEWKTIGPVVKKQSDVVWKRFIGACDEFFDRKSKLFNNVRQQEYANLKQKKAIVAQIKEILAAETTEDSAKSVRDLMKQWQEVGHVPFKDKDKIYQEYRAAVDEAFEKLDMRESQATLANFSSSISKLSGSDKIGRERERLVRAYEQKSSELKTFENNLGFFNATSKSGNSMVKEMERRIQKIQEEIAVLEQKIKIIDEKA